jgi:hypothetical protein
MNSRHVNYIQLIAVRQQSGVANMKFHVAVRLGSFAPASSMAGRFEMILFRRYELLIAGLATMGCGQDNSVDVAPARPVMESNNSADIELTPGHENLSGEQVRDGCRVDPFANPDLKAVVLIFVSTSCPIANRYAPTIQELYESYRSQAVGFWLVFADESESPEEIQEHLVAYKQRLPALRDTRRHLVAFCRATKSPEAVVFAPRWKLAYRGRIDDLFTDFGKRRDRPTRHDLRDAIDAVLAGRAVDPAESPVIGCDIPGAKP